MKKLFLTILCLMSLTSSIAGSDHQLTYLVSGTKKVLFALGRGIKHFYFPQYETKPSLPSNENFINDIQKWAQTSYEQGEAPFEDSQENLQGGETLVDSDLENEELVRYAHYQENLFNPICEHQTAQRITVSKSEKITFFSI